MSPALSPEPHLIALLGQAYDKAMQAKEDAVMCIENGDFAGAQVTH